MDNERDNEPSKDQSHETAKNMAKSALNQHMRNLCNKSPVDGFEVKQMRRYYKSYKDKKQSKHITRIAQRFKLIEEKQEQDSIQQRYKPAKNKIKKRDKWCVHEFTLRVLVCGEEVQVHAWPKKGYDNANFYTLNQSQTATQTIGEKMSYATENLFTFTTWGLEMYEAISERNIKNVTGEHKKYFKVYEDKYKTQHKDSVKFQIPLNEPHTIHQKLSLNRKAIEEYSFIESGFELHITINGTWKLYSRRKEEEKDSEPFLFHIVSSMFSRCKKIFFEDYQKINKSRKFSEQQNLHNCKDVWDFAIKNPEKENKNDIDDLAQSLSGTQFSNLNKLEDWQINHNESKKKEKKGKGK